MEAFVKNEIVQFAGLEISELDLATQDKISSIKDLFHPEMPGLGLDIGSGTGFTTFAFFGSRATACVDLHRPNLEYILRQASCRPNGPFRPLAVVARATALPFQANTFRYILCSEVLEHLEDDDLAVSEMARVLQPGGVALITVPFTGIGFPGFLELFGIKTVHDFPGPEFHVRPGYSEAGLRDVLAKHELKVEKVGFFLRFFTKAMVDFIAFFHILYQRLRYGRRQWTWSQVAEMESSFVLRLYSRVFPLFKGISKLDFFLKKRRGFGMIVVAKKLPFQ